MSLLNTSTIFDLLSSTGLFAPKKQVAGNVSSRYLGGKYQVLRVYSGGMGEVYICQVESNNTTYTVALKSFKKQWFFSRLRRLAFIRETNIWMQLTGQPHIMYALGLEKIDSRLFILMPAVESEEGIINVRDWMNQKSLSSETVLYFAFQLAFGMQCAQQQIPGLVHGDLKPENLLVIGETILVSDFGIAQVVSEVQDEIRLGGTWPYQAPERWDIESPISPTSDIYSFGIILYEWLTSEYPYHIPSGIQHKSEVWRTAHKHQTPNIKAMQEGISAELMKLSLNCLNKEPANRPPSFDVIFREIKRIAQEHIPNKAVKWLHRMSVMVQLAEEFQRAFRPHRINNLVDW